MWRVCWLRNVFGMKMRITRERLGIFRLPGEEVSGELRDD